MTQHEFHAHPGHITPKTLTLVFISLLVFLGISIPVAYINMGFMNIVVAIGIAFIKAMLVVLFFMQVKNSERIVWYYAFAGLIFLLIGLALSLADYLTRHPVILPKG